MRKNGASPSKVLLIFLTPLSLVILFAVINFEYMFLGKPIVLLDLTEKVGYDFRDFHAAGRYFLKGQDPWLWERFVTPPLSLYITLPFSFISAKSAVKLFFLINTICLLCGAYLYVSVFLKGRRIKLGKILFLMTLLFSYPVYFLLQRGNIDGIVFLLIALGLFFASKSEECGFLSDIPTAFFWALACHIKIYPLLLFIPLVLMRRWRLLFMFIFWLVFFVLVTHEMWPVFFQKTLARGSVFKLTENGSMLSSVVVFFLLNKVLFKSQFLYSLDTIKWISNFVFAFVLVINITLDFRRRVWKRSAELAEIFVMYIPFMVCVPNTVFHYEYVQLLGLVPFLIYSAFHTSRPHFLLYMMAFGIFLSQAHVAALYFLTENILSYYFPGLGVVLIILSSMMLKLMPRNETMVFDSLLQ